MHRNIQVNCILLLSSEHILAHGITARITWQLLPSTFNLSGKTATETMF